MHLPTIKTSCSYCGVGCGIQITRDRRGGLELQGDPDHPANHGKLCTKGRTLLHTAMARQHRLLYPEMRLSRDEARRRVSWDQAIDHVAGEFRAIQSRYGPDAVGLYVSGQCLTEEYYLANKLTKGFLQTANIDTNSRLCMSSAVMGYKLTLGSDAVPISYDDIEQTDTFLIAGANPAWCHPIIFRRIEAHKAAHRDTRIIVIDPRRTASCDIADRHLALRPGTDVALFLGLARELWKTGQIDEAFITRHTDGWDALVSSIESFTPEKTAQICDLSPRDIQQTAEWLGGPRRFLSLWTMGLNQSSSGVDKNRALIHLSLMTGKIGRPGCGPFSLTGQPNAMGGREVGGMATMLAAHRDLHNPEHRRQVAAHWGVKTVPDRPGLTAVDMFEALRSGRMKAIWIMCTNPVASLPAAGRVDEALRAAQLVVAQEIYPTETTAMADVVLPAAGWLEKTGTMTNSDRHISLLEKALEPPGEALSDSEIILRLARAMGWQEAFNYPDAESIFRDHAQLTRGTDLDISGLSYQKLRELRAVQWPFPEDSHHGTPRLYGDHVFSTPNGRAQFAAVEWIDRSEALTPDYPLVLTTGRIRDQWHTMTKTGLVSRLRQHIDVPFCEIHPDDARRRGLSDGQILEVRNARGLVQVAAKITADIRPGVVFLPMHWGKKLGGEFGRTNNITSAIVDPISKEPDFKFAAVEVRAHQPPKRKILIIGAGAAALAFCRQHRAYNTADSLEIFGEEPQPIYNRVLLPHYIDGSKSWEHLVSAGEEELARQQVTFHRGARIIAMDRAAQQIRDENGALHGYDLLVLATGSRPAVEFRGPRPERGVMALRSRRDADELLQALPGPSRVVINGGGLLGIELAGALAHLGHQVTILQRSQRLMSKQLDAKAAAYLAEELRDQGIQVLLESPLESIQGQSQLTSITLRSGTVIPCEMLIFATGIQPRRELAQQAGLACDRGIQVNGYQQTSDPRVFAIGEAAEFQGQTYGTTPAAEAQGKALAEYLRGNLHAPYRGTLGANILKLHGLSLASAGVVESQDLPGASEILLEDAAKRYYQKCIVCQDRLVGVIMMGDTRNFSQYHQLIDSSLELEEKRLELLRPGSSSPPVEGTLICSCHQIGSETLLRAVEKTGGNLQAICSATKAGTACGSCRPEISRLIASHMAHCAGLAATPTKESAVP